jgi:hypothetical protein
MVMFVRQTMEAVHEQWAVEGPGCCLEIRDAGLQVEHILGRHPGDGRATNVIDA